MSKIRGRFMIAVHFISTVSKMITIAWQAQPLCFFGVTFCLFVQGLVPLATAWLTKFLFDLLGQNIHGQPLSTLAQKVFFLLLAQSGLTIINQLISPANQYLSSELGRKLSLKIKVNIYQKINNFVGLTYFEDPHFHNIIKMAISGAQFSAIQTLSTIMTLLQGIVTVMTFLGVLITFNPLLAGVVAIAVLPQLFFQIKLGRQRFMTALNNSPKERRASYYEQVLSWEAFAKEMRLFNLGEYFLGSFVRLSREIQQAERSQQRGELPWRILLAFLESAIMSGAFVVVIIQAFSGHLSLGDIALYMSAVTIVQAMLMNIVYGLSQMNESTLFYSQYTNLLSLPEPLQLSSSPRPVPPMKSGITFRDISFRYGEQHPWVLRHTNLFLPVGKCLALVGLNGSGKTTLVKLLTRLYDPTEGQILWDGIDTREFDPQELRQHVGAIFQDFSHYDLTIQQNIGLGNVMQVENSEVVQLAAIKAGIHKRVMELPQGYQSLLGRWLSNNNLAINLSGGEWQKIALARMFIRNADILILDEPTAALDAQSEYDLHIQFRELMDGSTSLLITHRFSTVRMADIIAVIENGQITEYGTHTELMLLSGTYANLYNLQAEIYKYQEPSKQ